MVKSVTLIAGAAMTFFARPSDWTRAHKDAADATPLAGGSQHYFAFLSYSHQEQAIATWLHDELEKFRVPRHLVGRITEHGSVPRRLTPIFRDLKELPASGDLGSEIRVALGASQYLIVLCSPAAAKSRWTNAEIEAFKRARPEGGVFAAILAGEPFASEIPGREQEECLPRALRFKYDRRGRPTPKRAEPLAADLRGTGEARRLGFLKLVAGMLGVGLDDLVRRDEVRRQRRLATVAGGSLIGMLITTGLAVTSIQARDEAREQRREAEGLVGFMLGDLKDKLEPIGRLDALDAVGSRALAYYQRQDAGTLSDDALTQRARALTLMGEIAQTRGDTAGALKRYQEALASTAEAVRRYPDDPQRLFDHAQNVFYVGAISYQRGALGDAERSWREYKRLADRMAELAPDKKDYRLEQVYANTNLGTVLMDQRRYREAAATFQNSLTGAEALAAAAPGDVAYQKRVSNNLAWLADAHENDGALNQALGERERQLRLLSDIARIDPRDTEIPRDAMTAHRAVGRLLAGMGDVSGGLKELLASVAISDTLFRVEPDNTEWLQANASGRVDLADGQLAAGQTNAAAATARSHCDIVDRLLSRDSTVTDWKATQRSRCLELRARVALAQGDAQQASALARQALSAAQSSPVAADRSNLSLRSLAVGGDAFAALGRRDEAVKWWKAALQTVPQTNELRPVEQAAVAGLRLRLGDRAGAEPLMSSLAAMGYRNPAYVADTRKWGAK